MTFPAPVLLLPDTVHFKEFYGGFNGTCGETAVTAALICALHLGYDHDQAVAMMLSVTHEMQAHGWASANGASTLWSLAREAVLRHATIALEYDYQEPLQQDWHAVLLANAGIRPIVLQVGQAYNLVGQDGTGNDEAGVHYHFICVVGKCRDGYICMDGDNWQIENELVIYSYATLQAADICGLLMLEEVTSVGVPTGWKDANGVITAPNNITITSGFAQFVRDHFDGSEGEPLEEAFGRDQVELGNPSLGKGTIQRFQKRGQLTWRESDNTIFWTYSGQELKATDEARVAAEVAAATAKQAQTVAEQAVAALQAEVKQLQQQVSSKTDPAIVAALDAAAQYLSVPSQIANEVAAAQAKVVR